MDRAGHPLWWCGCSLRGHTRNCRIALSTSDRPGWSRPLQNMPKIHTNLPPRSAHTSGHHKSQFTFVFSFMFSSPEFCSIREISPGKIVCYAPSQEHEFQLSCEVSKRCGCLIAFSRQVHHKIVLLKTNPSSIIWLYCVKRTVFVYIVECLRSMETVHDPPWGQ